MQCRKLNNKAMLMIHPMLKRGCNFASEMVIRLFGQPGGYVRGTEQIEAAKHLRGEEAKRKIEAETGVTGVAEVWQLELSSYDSIKAFAKVETLDRLDAVIENAGVAPPDFALSEGFETAVAVNVVGTFLLAVLVLPKLRSSAAKTGEKARLTVAGSGTEFYAAGLLEKVDASVNILEHLSTKDKDMANTYPLSKLLQFYIFRELASHNPVSDGVVISYINPGLCKTDLGRDAGIVFKIQLFSLWKIMGRTAEQGSRTLIHGALAEEGCHGKYVSECVEKDQYTPELVTNEAGQKIQQRLWDELTEILNQISPSCI